MANVTQSEFEDIALSHLEELWGNYGPLFEIWFDGGYSQTLKPKVQEKLARLQPDATGFGGAGGLSQHPLCWVGTETGKPGQQLWSAGTDIPGDPDADTFCPKACDTTLQVRAKRGAEEASAQALTL